MSASETSSRDKHQRMKVDIHTHILPRSWPELEGVDIRLRHTGREDGTAIMEFVDGTFFREVKKNCFDPAAVLNDCDKHGVDVQCMCTVPVMFNYHLNPVVAKQWARFLNDDLAKTVRHNPKRLVGIGHLPMQDVSAACDELRYCVEKLGFKCFQIGSHINAWQAAVPGQADSESRVKNLMLNDECFEPLWKLSEELNVGFLVHPWDMEWCHKKYWLPWLVGMPTETTLAICCVMLGGILDKHPALKVMFAHGGGSFPGTVGRIEWGYKCRPDLVAVDSKVGPREYLKDKRIYVDSICHDEAMLEYLVELCGAGRIALGSDYPFPLGEVPSIAPTTKEFLTAYPGELIESSKLGDDDKKKLLGDTALEFLGLNAQDFDRHNHVKHVEFLKLCHSNTKSIKAHEGQLEPASKKARSA